MLGQLWPERMPIGEIPLIIMAVAGVSLIIAGWLLRRWARSLADVDAAPTPRRGGIGLSAAIVTIIGGLLLGASLAVATIAILGDPVRGWVRSLSSEASPVVALDGSDAEGVFAVYCANCHGKYGDKVPGLDLSSPEYLAQHSDSKIAAAIANGIDGMPGFKDRQGRGLTESQIGSLVKYLRSGTLREPQPAPSPTPTPSVYSVPGFDTFRNTCSCHVRSSVKGWDGQVLRSTDADAQATRGLHDFTGKLSEEDIEAVVRFITEAQQHSEDGAPYGGIIRHVDDWRQLHPSYVKANGASFCYQCHVNAFCARCHTEGRFPQPLSPASSPGSGGG